MKLKLILLSLGGSLALATAAHAASYVVNATDDLYNLDLANQAGDAPVAVNVTALTSISFAATGSVVLNEYSGNTPNDPDGVGAATSSSSNTGANGIAGLTAPNAGYLTGVFVGNTIDPTAPAALDFTTTSFASLSPALQQAFFIGDGLTGDNSGTTQIFYVPTGATTLYLGISDACGYNGGPSCYDDNYDSFSVTTTASGGAVPEPANWVLMVTGFGLLGWTIRQRGVQARLA